VGYDARAARLFVDRSSVEVFGGDGRTVISDRIFPRPDSRGVALFADGGTTELVSFRAWPLAAAVPRDETATDGVVSR
jgi:sucrose-6-phosphate hydrolase SacC (GH32 family)